MRQRERETGLEWAKPSSNSRKSMNILLKHKREITVFAQGYADNIQKKQLNRWEVVALGIGRDEQGTLTLTEKKSMLRKHSYVPYVERPVVHLSFEDVSVEGQGRPGGRTDRAGLLQGDACCGFGLQWPTKPVGMRARIQVQPVPKRPPPHFFFF